jgi:hypothetical protein
MLFEITLIHILVYFRLYKANLIKQTKQNKKLHNNKVMAKSSDVLDVVARAWTDFLIYLVI